jgi:integrase/recombinase XerD
MKLSVALSGYWLDKQLSFSPNTVASYNVRFRYLLSYLGDVDIEQVTTDHIRQFLIHLRIERKLSRRSVRDAWVSLSSLWTWAEAELSIPHIIRGKIAAPTFTKKTVEPFTAEEVRRLVRAAEYQRSYTLPSGKRAQGRRPTANRDKSILLTLLDSGLRISELCALTIADYDAPRGRLHVRHGKGDKERYVVIGNRARKSIWSYLAGRTNASPAEPLFAARGGRPLRRDNLRHMLARLGEEAQVANVYPHRFRHTFAITFLRNGGNPLLLQELLGHEQLATVLVYVKLAEQDVDGASRFSPADGWGLGG